MAERKTFKLQTIAGKGGFYTLDTDRNFVMDCSQKGKPKCVSKDNGYWCAKCPLAESDSRPVSDWYKKELGYSSVNDGRTETLKNVPFELRVEGNKIDKIGGKIIEKSSSMAWYNGNILFTSH